ncbi:protein LNK3-like isoform X1 [Melia azedarach]|uniref:Protein LNK3-like isoform X1 n=1 Tax=Melia azedarach TaxID=155640 RepID=A0ACC1YAW6_MELAZ|nr:protein LNK3-like isoform X1 [Melia azedarach]
MEWYSGSVVDDLVVPRGQELADGVPSSPEFEVLSKWGTYTPDNFVSPNKYFSLDTNTMEEEFNFNGFCNEDNIESSIQDRSHSSRSSICAGSSEESQQRTAVSSERTDYQLDHFAGIEQLDDIFLNSLMEDMPSTEDLHESFCFAPESQYGVLLANNLTTDLSLDSQRNSSDKHITGSSKYLKTHAFSPSVVCKHREVVASPFMPSNSEHEFLQVKAPLVKPQVPSEQNIANELVGEESPMEESVLQELKMVMDQQLNDKTRICFRDALYRLAENSKQHVVSSAQNGDFPSETPITSHDMDTRGFIVWCNGEASGMGKTKQWNQRPMSSTEP